MRHYYLKGDNKWNPLKKISNSKCICNSDKKVKKCCGQNDWVSGEQFEVFKAYADYKRDKISITEWNKIADAFNKAVKEKRDAKTRSESAELPRVEEHS